jgi:hypothetical protein
MLAALGCPANQKATASANLRESHEWANRCGPRRALGNPWRLRARECPVCGCAYRFKAAGDWIDAGTRLAIRVGRRGLRVFS